MHGHPAPGANQRARHHADTEEDGRRHTKRMVDTVLFFGAFPFFAVVAISAITRTWWPMYLAAAAYSAVVLVDLAQVFHRHLHRRLKTTASE